MLGAHRLHVRIGGEVAGQDRHRERGVVVHLGADLDVVDLEAGVLERLLQAAVALAALGLGEQAVLQRLVARLQVADLDHLLAGQPAARVQLDPGVAEALGLVLLEQLGQRRVAAGDHDVALLRLGDQVGERARARVAHDHDAVRIGGQRLAEVVEHLLGQPAGVLLDQIGDAERLGRGARAVGARQGRAIAGLPPICM